MPRGRTASSGARLLVATFIVLWAFAVGASPAAADDAKERQAGAAAAAKVVCAPLATIPGVKYLCLEKAGAVFERATDASPGAICTAVTRGIPPLNRACRAAIDGVMERAYAAYRTAASAVKVAVKAVQFVANPSGGLDDLANKAKAGAVDLTTAILKEATTATRVDFNAKWFRSQYAGAAGLGLFVMAILFLGLCHQLAKGKIDGDEFAHTLFFHTPIALLMMSFSPVIGAVISPVTDALAAGAANLTGQEIGTFLTGKPWQAIQMQTSGAFPGGVLCAIVAYGLMAFGALSTFIGLIMQKYAIYMSSITVAIAWGMYAHPVWRAKTRKVLAFVLSTMLAKPALILLLGASFAYLNGDSATWGDSGLDVLAGLFSIALVLLAVGLAPWALLKFMPLMPNGNEWRQSSGGNVSEAAVGGAAGGVSSVISNRAMQISQTQRSGSTGAAQQPPPRPGSETSGTPSPGAQQDSARPPGDRTSPGRSNSPAGTAPAGKPPGSSTGAGTGTVTGGSAGAGAGTAAARGGAVSAGAAGGPLGVAAAQVASSVAQGAARRVRQIAEDGDPEMREDQSK